MPSISQHPPNPFSILLHGCMRKSACKDHSNMVDSSMAYCWLGQSGAQKIKRREKSTVGLPQDGPLPWWKVCFPQKSMTLFFQVPVFWGVATSLLILDPKFYTTSWNFSPSWSSLFCTSLLKHTPFPSQWIIPVGMCHQVLLGALAYKNQQHKKKCFKLLNVIH